MGSDLAESGCESDLRGCDLRGCGCRAGANGRRVRVNGRGNDYARECRVRVNDCRVRVNGHRAGFHKMIQNGQKPPAIYPRVLWVFLQQLLHPLARVWNFFAALSAWTIYQNRVRLRNYKM